MLETTNNSAGLLKEPLGALNRRLTTFSFSNHQGCTNIHIVGCFHLEPVRESFEFVRGKIRIGTKSYIVYDKQAMKDGLTKEITEETCIILLDEGESLYQEGTAIIVDDAAELLSLLEEKNLNLVAPEMLNE